MRATVIAAVFLLSACGGETDQWLAQFDGPTASIHDRPAVLSVIAEVQAGTDDLVWTDPWSIVYGNGPFTSLVSETVFGYSCADDALDAKEDFRRQSEDPTKNIEVSFKEDIEECSAKRGRGKVRGVVNYNAKQVRLRYRQVMSGFCGLDGHCVDGVSVRVWEERAPNVRVRSVWDLNIESPSGEHSRRIGGYQNVSGGEPTRRLIFVHEDVRPESYLVSGGLRPPGRLDTPFTIRGRDGEIECLRFQDSHAGYCRPDSGAKFNWP